jgi:hypothetical protein
MPRWFRPSGSGIVPAMPAAPTRYEIAAWLMMAAGLLLTLGLHLMPALLAGLQAVQLVHVVVPRVAIGRFEHAWAKVLMVSRIPLAAPPLLGGMTYGRRRARTPRLHGVQAVHRVE